MEVPHLVKQVRWGRHVRTRGQKRDVLIDDSR